VAACLADEDDAINDRTKKISEVEQTAIAEFASLKAAVVAKDGCLFEEVVAANVYAKFAKDNVSKAIAAQYLAERLKCKHSQGILKASNLREQLPKYVTMAIDYVTGFDSTNPQDHKVKESGAQ
jgi:putative ATP-dependent endonuclease of OLD family